MAAPQKKLSAAAPSFSPAAPKPAAPPAQDKPAAKWAALASKPPAASAPAPAQQKPAAWGASAPAAAPASAPAPAPAPAPPAAAAASSSAAPAAAAPAKPVPKWPHSRSEAAAMSGPRPAPAPAPATVAASAAASAPAAPATSHSAPVAAKPRDPARRYTLEQLRALADGYKEAPAELREALASALANVGKADARPYHEHARPERARGEELDQTPVEPLQITSEGYKVLRQRVVKFEANEALRREMNDVLNKLTRERFGSMVKRALSLQVASPDLLNDVVSSIFERALAEPNFSDMYARFCVAVKDKMRRFEVAEPGGGRAVLDFRRLLLIRCQKEFEDDEHRAQQLAEEPDAERREELSARLRRRVFATHRFIGELYVHNLLRTGVMCGCITKLLADAQRPDPDGVEALCRMLTTAGAALEADSAAAEAAGFSLDRVVAALAALESSPALDARRRFQVRNLVELRQSGWRARDAKAAAPAAGAAAGAGAAAAAAAGGAAPAQAPAAGSENKKKKQQQKPQPQPQSQQAGAEGGGGGGGGGAEEEWETVARPKDAKKAAKRREKPRRGAPAGGARKGRAEDEADAQTGRANVFDALGDEDEEEEEAAAAAAAATAAAAAAAAAAAPSEGDGDGDGEGEGEGEEEDGDGAARDDGDEDAMASEAEVRRSAAHSHRGRRALSHYLETRDLDELAGVVDALGSSDARVHFVRDALLLSFECHELQLHLIEALIPQLVARQVVTVVQVDKGVHAVLRVAEDAALDIPMLVGPLAACLAEWFLAGCLAPRVFSTDSLAVLGSGGLAAEVLARVLARVARARDAAAAAALLRDSKADWRALLRLADRAAPEAAVARLLAAHGLAAADLASA